MYQAPIDDYDFLRAMSSTAAGTWTSSPPVKSSSTMFARSCPAQRHIPESRHAYFKMAVDGGSATKIGSLLGQLSRSGRCTRYEVSRDGLDLIQIGSTVASEPAIESATP